MNEVNEFQKLGWQELRIIQGTMLIAPDNTRAMEWAKKGPTKYFATLKQIDMKLTYVMELI